MNNATKMKIAIGAIVLSVALLSCADAGTGGSDASGSSASQGSSVSVAGPMERGSIIVGGIRFDDSQVQVSADEAAQTEAYLENGMTVRLIGTVNADGVTGVATAVEVENELRGPVSAIDATAETFDIFGFTVVVSGETVFDDGESFATLAVGDTIEVYGFQLGDGRIRATRVDEQDSDDGLEIRGIVSAVTSTSFKIGASSTTFTYDSSTTIEGGTGIVGGDLIEAEIDLSGASPYATTIELERVEDEEYYDEDEAEVEGVVAGFSDTSSSFLVGTTTVQLSNSVEYDGGDAQKLRNGVTIEAEGSFSGTTLNADEISFEDDVELIGNADSAGAAGVFGITITGSGLTEFDDSLVDLTAIAAGDPLSIEGFVLADGSVTAISVSLLSEAIEADHYALQGPVTAIASVNEIEILGITVDLSNATELSEDDGPALTPSEFNALLETGTLVEAEGSFSGGTFSAVSAEID